MKYPKTLMFLLFGITLLSACSKSPEDKLADLVPRFQKAICEKTIECSKDQLAKIPPQFRDRIPAYMQSEEACISFHKDNFEKAKKKREEKKEKITPELIAAFETCVKAMESSTCEPFQGRRGGKAGLPECENLQQFSN